MQQRSMSSMIQLKPEDVFAADPNIRWAGLATVKGEVIFCQMREGVESLTPEDDDRLLLELRAQYMTETTERVGRWAGPVEYIAVSYEKFIELIIMLKGKYLAITLEKNVPAQALPDIARIIRSFSGSSG